LIAPIQKDRLYRIESHSRRADMDYLGGAIICSFLNAFLKLLENHALVQLSCNPELRA